VRRIDELDLSVCELPSSRAFERRINRRGGAGIRRGTGRGNSVGGQQGGPVLVGLRNFSSANSYATQPGGGEPGVSTGFGILRVFIPRAIIGTQVLANRDSGSAGYTLYLESTGDISAAAVSGAPGYVTAPLHRLAASDVGKIIPALMYLDGSGKLRLWVRRVQQGPGVLISGYTPALPTFSEYLGVRVTGNPAVYCDILGGLAFRGQPTDAQIAALFDFIRDTGDVPLPSEWPYGITHRISVRDAFAGMSAVTGQVAPASIADTVTGTAVDAMGRVGSPTVVAIEPSIDGRKSYGVQGYATTSYLATAQGAGIRGSVSGFHVRVAVIFYSLTGSEYVATCCNSAGNGGWAILRSTNTLRMDCGNGSTYASSLRTLTAADLGVPHVVEFHFTGSQVEQRFDGVASAAAAAPFAPAPGNVPMIAGALVAGAYPAATTAVQGLAGANVVQSLADSVSAYAEFLRTGKLPMPSGPGAHYYDFTLDIAENGGPEAGVPATCRDRVGTDHLTRVGTGLTVAQRVERLFSYESSPILYGATMPTPADSYESAIGFAGDNAAFWGLVFFMLNAQGAANVSTAVRTLFSRRGAANGGWDLSTSGPNGMLAFGCGGTGGTGKVASSSFVLSATDVGKLLLAYGIWDGPAQTARLVVKRAQVGAGVVFTGGTFVPESGSTFLGRRQDGQPCDSSITIYGAACGLGVPTIAEIQAHHDDVMANEQLLRGIPGKTSLLIDLKADVIANGGALPAQALDRVGSAHFARNGNPTLARQYARAWGW
jgi:hypothetical protein